MQCFPPPVCSLFYILLCHIHNDAGSLFKRSKDLRGQYDSPCGSEYATHAFHCSPRPLWSKLEPLTYEGG